MKSQLKSANDYRMTTGRLNEVTRDPNMRPPPWLAGQTAGVQLGAGLMQGCHSRGSAMVSHKHLNIFKPASQWLLLVALIVIPTEGLVPVLYPSSRETAALVEDVEASEVIFGRGSFSKFVCRNRNSPSEASFASVECETVLPNLFVRTSESTIKLAASFINATGFPVAFLEGEPTIKINNTVTDLESSRESFLGLVEFTVTIGANDRIVVEMNAGEESRSVFISRDTVRPTAQTKTGDSSELRKEVPVAEFLVTFSEPVLSGSDLTCDADIPQLTGAETVATVLEKSLPCAEDLRKASFNDTYSITNVNSSEAFYDASRNVLVVRGFPDPTPQVEPERIMITFQFEVNSVEDYAGNTNSGAQFTIAARYTPPRIAPPPPPAPPIPPPPPPSPPPKAETVEIVNATETAEAVGKATTAVVVAASVSTLGGSVVAAATTTATAAAGGMGGASGVGTAAAGTNAIGGVVSILNMGQKIYLTGQLAVAVPENYQAFTEQLKWTMFNIRAPWESDNVNATRSSDKRNVEREGKEQKANVVLLAEIGGLDKKVELAEGPSPLPSSLETDTESRFEQGAQLLDKFYTGERRKVLKRVLFWVSILYSVVITSHLLLLFTFRRMNKDIPSVLHVPRLEISISYWTMPAIATACAGMFQGTSVDVFVGALVLVLLPGTFFGLHLFVIWHYFLTKDPTEWEARVLLDPQPQTLPRQPSKASIHSIRSHPITTGFSQRSSTDGKTDVLLPEGSSSHLSEIETENTEDNDQAARRNKSALLPPESTPVQMGPIGDGHHRVSSLVNHYESFSRTIDGSIDAIEIDEVPDPHPGRAPPHPHVKPSHAQSGEISPSNATLSVHPPELSEKSWRAPQPLSEPSRKSDPSKKSWIVSDVPIHGGVDDTIGQKIVRCFDVLLFWLWLGRPMQKVEWTKVDASSLVLERFGPMFEQNRAIGLVMTRDASYQVDPKTGKLDRGAFRAVPEYLPLVPACIPIRRHHLQLFTTAANFLKLVLFAVIIGAEEDDESLSQLIALIFISSAFCLFLRSARPQMVRVELALAILAEAADMVTFVLGLLLILGPTSEHGFRKSIGLGMLWTEGVAFGLLVIEKLLNMLSSTIKAIVKFREKRRFKSSKGKTLMEALWTVITTHPGNLERKFFHKWMVKSLGKGLNGKVLLGRELKYMRAEELSKKTSFLGLPFAFSMTLKQRARRKNGEDLGKNLSVV